MARENGIKSGATIHHPIELTRENKPPTGLFFLQFVVVDDVVVPMWLEASAIDGQKLVSLPE